MAATHNLIVNQGEDFQRVLRIKDESDTLIDLTGYSFRGQAKLKFGETEPQFSFEFTVRDQGSDIGTLDMLISAASTAALSIGKATDYVYDVEMIRPDLKVKRLFQGKLQLSPEVTK